MKFEVEAGGRRRTIEVQRSGTGWNVTVGGRAMSASLVQAGSRWSLLVAGGEGGPSDSGGALGRPASSYEIALQSSGRGEYVVCVDGRTVSISVLDPRNRVARSRGSSEAAGPSSVISPMPGRVVRLLVVPGEKVAARQGVAVVEAMKMENELRAPRAGTVTEVCVREGASVEANTVLVMISP